MSTMRRFWDEARVGGGPGAWSVLLDGKPLLVPGAGPLTLRFAALAEAVAAEWQAAGGAKGGALSMEAVPLTRLAGTAQERIAPDPAAVAAELARYAETDLLCYRAEHPLPLVAREARAWQPWLDWLDERHGARLEPTEGIVHRAQDPAALARLHAAFGALPVEVLAALGIAVPALGSAVLGLAMAEGALGAVAAHELAALDELFEEEAWGEDAEATMRRAAVLADLRLVERFLGLLR